MVKVIIEQGRKLSPLKLLPAMVICNSELHAIEIIKYFEYCINGLKNTDKAVHNFLLSLYAKYDAKKLMEYLKSQGHDINMVRIFLKFVCSSLGFAFQVNYDVHFALRLCRENNLTLACVQLSGTLGLWESAVDLALNEDLELAKKMANSSPENDTELRKKLWLKLGTHHHICYKKFSLVK